MIQNDQLYQRFMLRLAKHRIRLKALQNTVADMEYLCELMSRTNTVVDGVPLRVTGMCVSEVVRVTYRVATDMPLERSKNRFKMAFYGELPVSVRPVAYAWYRTDQSSLALRHAKTFVATGRLPRCAVMYEASL